MTWIPKHTRRGKRGGLAQKLRNTAMPLRIGHEPAPKILTDHPAKRDDTQTTHILASNDPPNQNPTTKIDLFCGAGTQADLKITSRAVNVTPAVRNHGLDEAYAEMQERNRYHLIGRATIASAFAALGIPDNPRKTNTPAGINPPPASSTPPAVEHPGMSVTTRRHPPRPFTALPKPITSPPQSTPTPPHQPLPTRAPQLGEHHQNDGLYVAASGDLIYYAAFLHNEHAYPVGIIISTASIDTDLRVAFPTRDGNTLAFHTINARDLCQANEFDLMMLYGAKIANH